MLNEQTAKVVFYTPDAEMSESEEYLNKLSYLNRALRNVAHLINILNSNYTSKILCVDTTHHCKNPISYVNYSKDIAIDYTSFDATSIAFKANKNFIFGQQSDELIIRDEVLGHGKTLSGEIATIYSISSDGTILEWEVRGKTYHRGNFCHVELVLGDNSYFIRWASVVRKQRKKTYSKAGMVYKIVDINMESTRYEVLLNYMEKCVDDQMGFNYLGLYTNFTLPNYVKYYCFSNGANYQCNNGTFCSELVALALNEAKLVSNEPLVDAIVFNPTGSDDQDDSSYNIPIQSEKDVQNRIPSIRNSLTPCSDVRVNASLISPNDLYLLLMGLSNIIIHDQNTPVIISSGTLSS